MGATISKVQDANVYVNGTSTHGQASEVTLPEVQFGKNEYKALGLVGVMKLWNKTIEALEATIKWNYPENDVQIACANPSKTIDLMVRSNKTVFGDGEETEEPVVVFLKGTSNNHGLGSYKKGEDTDLSTKLDISYLKQVVNGREIVEIDVLNNIFRIDGTDLLAQYRKNLGI